MPPRWTTKGPDTVATLGSLAVRFEAAVIAQRLSSLKSMLLMHKPELMATEQGRQTLNHMAMYLTQLQTTLRPRALRGE